jgi:hypothetical protein
MVESGKWKVVTPSETFYRLLEPAWSPLHAPTSNQLVLLKGSSQALMHVESQLELSCLLHHLNFCFPFLPLIFFILTSPSSSSQLLQYKANSLNVVRIIFLHMVLPPSWRLVARRSTFAMLLGGTRRN